MSSNTYNCLYFYSFYDIINIKLCPIRDIEHLSQLGRMCSQYVGKGALQPPVLADVVVGVDPGGACTDLDDPRHRLQRDRRLATRLRAVHQGRLAAKRPERLGCDRPVLDHDVYRPG